MSMHKSGRNDTITPGASCDLKLADYINRKSKHDALINSKPKMTFDDWLLVATGRDRHYHKLYGFQGSLEFLEECWNASRKNS